MRIAMLTNNYKPFIGGVPISIERLSDGLRKLGHEVYIFAPTYENQVEEEYVIRYKSLRGKLGGGIVIPNIFDKEIEKKFKNLKFDMIHVHHPMLIGNTAQYLGKKHNIPVAYTYHTRYEEYLHFLKPFEVLENRSKNENLKVLGEIENMILSYSKEKFVPNRVRNFVNRCDLVFAPTNMMRDYLFEGGANSKIEVLPTGLEEDYFKEKGEESINIREKYKGNKEYLFCTVSRLSKEKNFDFLIKGLRELKDRIGNTFNTIVIGDGDYKEELIKKVKELDLEENITFINSISNKRLKDYYKACDLFLFSSKSETQGIVLLEAMASRLPVVALKASGVIDVVVNGVNGYMTDESTELWSNRIIDILSKKEEMERLKIGAFQTASRYLSINIAKRAEKHYEYAINEAYRKGLEYGIKVG